MKKIYLTIAILICLSGGIIKAQTQLWGVAQYGGARDSGTIFMGDGNGNNFHAVYSCSKETGTLPFGKLCLANNGKLYGVMESGGCQDFGCCYSYDPASGIFTNIYDFVCPTHLKGYGPAGGMMIASDGNLYGLCNSGGIYGEGVIFKIDPTTDTYSDIFDFAINYDLSQGIQPIGIPIQLSDGKLCGMFASGGANNFGGIYSFDILTSSYNLLYSFDSVNGAKPWYGGLLNATDGKLYGMTFSGGAYNYGVIFSYDISTNTITDLHDFKITDNGHGPTEYLIQATNGKLYGMAGLACTTGSLFEFDITTNTFTELIVLNNNRGIRPYRSLFQASNGKLYGTTTARALNQQGDVFSYDITTNIYSVLVNLDSNTIGNYSSCDIIETPVLTGIPQINNKICFSLYPNPFSTSATLVINGVETLHATSLQIINLLGQEVKTIPIINPNTDPIGITINRDNLPDGMYFYKIISQNKETMAVGKMVIN